MQTKGLCEIITCLGSTFAVSPSALWVLVLVQAATKRVSILLCLLRLSNGTPLHFANRCEVRLRSSIVWLKTQRVLKLFDRRIKLASPSQSSTQVKMCSGIVGLQSNGFHELLDGQVQPTFR